MTHTAYTICRSSRRRTVSIHIHPDCTVRVLAPKQLSDKQISDFVTSKCRWIKTQIAYFQEARKNFVPRQYVTGECFTYLGRKYRLNVSDGDGAVKLSSGQFFVPVLPSLSRMEQTRSIRQQLMNWYVAHALDRLTEKTEQYASIMECSPTSVIVKDYKSRWGCCYSDGRIMYNWRLIVAAQPIVDYVVVHELAHLKHNNHSKRFWSLVKHVLPDYQERRQWLKLNAGGLTV